MARQSIFKTAQSCLLFSRAELPPKQKQGLRLYNVQSNEAAIAKLPGINPGALSVTRTTTPKNLLPPEELVFGRNFTGILGHL